MILGTCWTIFVFMFMFKSHRYGGFQVFKVFRFPAPVWLSNIFFIYFYSCTNNEDAQCSFQKFWCFVWWGYQTRCEGVQQLAHHTSGTSFNCFNGILDIVLGVVLKKNLAKSQKCLTRGGGLETGLGFLTFFLKKIKTSLKCLKCPKTCNKHIKIFWPL